MCSDLQPTSLSVCSFIPAFFRHVPPPLPPRHQYHIIVADTNIQRRVSDTFSLSTGLSAERSQGRVTSAAVVMNSPDGRAAPDEAVAFPVWTFFFALCASMTTRRPLRACRMQRDSPRPPRRWQYAPIRERGPPLNATRLMFSSAQHTGVGADANLPALSLSLFLCHSIGRSRSRSRLHSRYA